MTLIQLRSVEKFYGGRAVLRGVEMKVATGARIGLVGGNGAGKSTLLRVLAGLEEVDGGEVIRRRGSSVAYLPQHVGGDGGTPLEALRAARPELAELRDELEDCEAQLGAPEVASDLRRMQRLLAPPLVAHPARAGDPARRWCPGPQRSLRQSAVPSLRRAV